MAGSSCILLEPLTAADNATKADPGAPIMIAVQLAYPSSGSPWHACCLDSAVCASAAVRLQQLQPST